MIYLYGSIILLIVLFLYYSDNFIEINKFDYYNERIPASFSGLKIVHISDLHNKKFGKNQNVLLKKVVRLSPDIIVITGDLIDRRRYNLKIAMQFIKRAVRICPVYFVSGNHETWSVHTEEIIRALKKAGVIILNESISELKRNGNVIEILGIPCPTMREDELDIDRSEDILKTLSHGSAFKILLSHRPEFIKMYASYGVDICFSGHAHGGQIRLPFIKGILAPNQGFFPKYTGGRYDVNNTTLFLSRGLGNSIFPFRIFNQPNIIKVTLYKK